MGKYWSVESKFLFKRLIILMIIDALSTIILLDFGCGVETNPITFWFHKKFGVILGQLLNSIIVDIPGGILIAGIIGLYHEHVHKKIGRVLSYAILITFGYVVAGNLWILLNCF